MAIGVQPRQRHRQLALDGILAEERRHRRALAGLRPAVGADVDRDLRELPQQVGAAERDHDQRRPARRSAPQQPRVASDMSAVPSERRRPCTKHERTTCVNSAARARSRGRLASETSGPRPWSPSGRAAPQLLLGDALDAPGRRARRWTARGAARAAAPPRAAAARPPSFRTTVIERRATSSASLHVLGPADRLRDGRRGSTARLLVQAQRAPWPPGCAAPTRRCAPPSSCALAHRAHQGLDGHLGLRAAAG